MKWQIVFTTIMLALVACSSSNSTNDVPLEDGTSFDGMYEISAESTTEFDRDGGTCGGGTGTMTIAGSRVSGSVLGSTSGQLYELTGSVDTEGNIDAGVAVGQQDIVAYEGRIVGDSGSGTWMDFFGCLGVWSMRLVALPTV